MGVKLLILCLRRSGSTVFWKTLRQDERFRCFDEPLSPVHLELPTLDRKGANHELADLVHEDPRRFWSLYSPVSHADELTSELTDRQQRYLRFLLDGADHVLCDLTRVSFKLQVLERVAPDAHVIHLYRSPQAFATSILLPNIPERSGTGRLALWLLNRAHRRRFWSLRQPPRFWGYREIVGDADAGLFSTWLTDRGLLPDGFNRLPAFARLMYFWKVCYETVETDGRALFGKRFLSLPFETFCRDPRGCVDLIYRGIGLSPPDLDFRRIRAASPGYAAGDSRWAGMAERLGMRRLDAYPWIDAERPEWATGR